MNIILIIHPTNEVVLVIVSQEYDKCVIVIHDRADRLHELAETNQTYNALQHPLWFVNMSIVLY